MTVSKFLLVAAVSGLVTAWPEPTAAAYLDNRAIDCSKVTGCLSVLKKIGPPATTFCGSYVKISATKITTTTFTPVAVTKTTSTTTVTVTSAACSQQKRNAHIDNRGFEYARAADVEDIKRGDILGLLAAFADAKISEGCSCLNLQPKATKTTIFTAATPTVKVVATSTQCVVSQPPVCKPNGFGNTCTQNIDCCSGACGATFDSSICCNPTSQSCDLDRPDGCCSGTCLNTGDLNNPDGTCI